MAARTSRSSPRGNGLRRDERQLELVQLAEEPLEMRLVDDVQHELEVIVRTPHDGVLEHRIVRRGARSVNHDLVEGHQELAFAALPSPSGRPG